MALRDASEALSQALNALGRYTSAQSADTEDGAMDADYKSAETKGDGHGV